MLMGSMAVPVRSREGLTLLHRQECLCDWRLGAFRVLSAEIADDSLDRKRMLRVR